MSSSGSSSLRPAWHKGASGGGRGFQPPPTVSSDRGDKARSSSWGSQERRDANKFSASKDEDSFSAKSDERNALNARSEAFRTSFGRSTSTGSKASGRSLADLAARVPDGAPAARRQSSNYDSRGNSSTGRFGGMRAGDQGGPGLSGSLDAYKPDPNIVRYTREKLLSMRPPSHLGDKGLPSSLSHLDGSSIVSKTAQDPVCWDTLDAEEIWEPVRERRLAAGLKVAGGSTRSLTESVPEDPRRRNAPSSGRWQRGVALPPPEEAGRRKERDEDNPDELWDDPIGGATGAAADFSAFGAMPDDTSPEPFDFDRMAEASKQLEEELHGSLQGSKEGDMNDDDVDENHQAIKVDPSRPLASAGMTLASGSGDGVNVFEDFDSPVEGEAVSAIRGGGEDPSASSRLMQMIGVTKDVQKNEIGPDQEASNPWGAQGNEVSNQPGLESLISLGGATSIPLNPWGNPISLQQVGNAEPSSLGSFAANHQKGRDGNGSDDAQQRAQEAEILRRRQEEEAQRRLLAQRQAEEQARQHAQVAALQQQQAASQHSQVELVLMERICAILENSWGRSDLVSILTTLHSEDSRVIPLVNSVDALRALIARSPQRIALRRDPNFSADMAVLSMTNAQWQQQQVQARLQQEEAQRRSEEAIAREKANRGVASATVNPDAPWFYSDPQNNIQGPFRGEEMRQWLEAGYFKGDLPISQQPGGPFLPLSALFTDLAVAFRVVSQGTTREEAPKRNSADEASRQKRADEEEKKAIRAAQAKQAEAAEREMIGRERQQSAQITTAENQNAASSGGIESSSAQLKMMLGLAPELSPGEETKQTKAPVSGKVKSQKAVKESSKGGKRGGAMPAEGSSDPVLVDKTSNPSPAWGGAANTKSTKSMSEIQQEEARAAALMAIQRDGMPRQASSGWANVAASGKAGWSSGTLKPAAPASVSNFSGINTTRIQQNHGKAQQNSARNASPISRQQRSSSIVSSTPAEEFGTTMSSALEHWCKDQMQQINGSDDLTLVAFCMTLDDANEIRQYLTTYLGSTSQVNNFASEFISKRGLGSKQEEWETPGSAKKGRKKKNSGR
eukprot:scaffold5517_cov135-Cylindrotheca_fusiformis.AAC.21